MSTQADKLVSMENSQHGFSDTAHKSSKSKPLLGRPLGGLEIMYHHTLSKGTDVIWLLFKVNTVFPVNAAMVENALYFLAEKHPLLRMTIQYDANDLYFLETDDVQLDFSESDRSDWLQFILEEVSVPFAISKGPLWKCRLLKAEPPGEREREEGAQVVSDGLVHESIVMFILHHSVTDGRYNTSLISQFVDTLNKISLGTLSTTTPRAVPLLPPVEDMMLCPPDPRTPDGSDSVSSSSINANFSDPPTKALDDYNLRFNQEIQDIWSAQLRNNYLIHEFTRQDTSQMLRSCKDTGVSCSGVFVTACVQAFADLVYPSSSPQNSIIIPVEFMVDLRRYCPKDISKGAILC